MKFTPGVPGPIEMKVKYSPVDFKVREVIECSNALLSSFEFLLRTRATFLGSLELDKAYHSSS